MTYNFSYKILIGAKTLRIRFDKINGSISIYDESRYLVLLGPKKYDLIYDRIRYLIGLKSNIKYVFFRNYGKVNVDSYESLTTKKRWLCIMLLSVLYKDLNRCYYNIF